MIASVTVWVADAVLLGALTLVTLAVVGAVRLPDAYMKLHSAAKATSLAIVGIALAACLDGDPAIFFPALVIAGFVLVTAAVSAHAIGLAAARRGEPLKEPDEVDESGMGLLQDPRGHE